MQNCRTDRGWRRSDRPHIVVAVKRDCRFTASIATLLLAPCVAAWAAGAPPQGPDNEGSAPRVVPLAERTQVHFVMVSATVTNRRGRIVTGLDADDFKLFEDYQPRPIEFFGTETDLPVAIAFLLDLSGSMRQVGKLDEAKEAIRVFVDSLQTGDRFGLVGFADEQVRWITDFTGERETFLRRLSVQRAYGQTALFDAVAATPGLVDRSVEGRKAIVLFTDGEDNASRLNTFDATTTARQVSVPIYTIGFSALAPGVLAAGESQRRHAVLRRFSNETGGRMFVVHDPDELKEAVLAIQAELRHQYVIGYYPHPGAWDGSFRRIRLETRRRELTVRARNGYYAGP